MFVTTDILEAFLSCRTKALLYAEGAAGTLSEYGEWRLRSRQSFAQEVSQRLRHGLTDDEWHLGLPSIGALKHGIYQLILQCKLGISEMSSDIDALQIGSPRRQAKIQGYIPIRFALNEKLTKTDKLLLAFDAFILYRVLGEMPEVGRIIHGSNYTTVTVKLAGFVPEISSILRSLQEAQANAAPMPIVLNRHCCQCEFRSQCRQVAIEKDDLSLLANISAKERQSHNNKGIFTVTQLSYAFRPRKRSSSLPQKHHTALKALAIRKKQIHVFGTPPTLSQGTPVYLDVEGDPDRDFYYLVGLRYSRKGADEHHSFWADTRSGEGNMWSDCLRTLALIQNPRIVHYGSYEVQFLKRMRNRYPDLVGSYSLIDELISTSLNILSITYAYVYFPTYSNRLKDIAGYLGFEWSFRAASGLTTIAWRSRWECTGDPELKQRLLTYNAEDCEALQRVAEAIVSITSEDDSVNAKNEVVKVSALGREFARTFGELDYALPEFRTITKAAYWDYQREKVYVRSRQPKRVLTGGRKSSPDAPATNKIIPVQEQRPECCSRCAGMLIYKTGRFSQTVYDLRFSIGGLRRWIVRYTYDRYICWKCKASFNRYVRKSKYGHNLKAYVVYQIIELRIPQHAVAQSLTTLFGFEMLGGSINRIKASSADYYEKTYRSILRRIGVGPLVHADETKVTIADQDRYVWVFTSMDEVAFVYSDTREAEAARDVLRDFQGVLVSDFYAGYDSIDCAQQKCLIHLMRDLNDDVLHHPFNDEMNELARSFATLLTAMLETVDRFGLKARNLRKHKEGVDRFYRMLQKRDYQTEVARAYKKRFEKNRDKLFTFLDYDGVPWNNNNAEHAIKAFARLRNVIGAKSSVKGIRDYLVLLSVSETCKYKGIRFLDFLRSGQLDFDALDK